MIGAPFTVAPLPPDTRQIVTRSKDPARSEFTGAAQLRPIKVGGSVVEPGKANQPRGSQDSDQRETQWSDGRTERSEASTGQGLYHPRDRKSPWKVWKPKYGFQESDCDA